MEEVPGKEDSNGNLIRAKLRCFGIKCPYSLFYKSPVRQGFLQKINKRQQILLGNGNKARLYCFMLVSSNLDQRSP